MKTTALAVSLLLALTAILTQYLLRAVN